MSSPAIAIRRFDVPLARLDGHWPALRIAHVSDFHFRRWNSVTQAAQQQLLALSDEYDLVVATGDFGHVPDKWASVVEPLRRFFEPIAERVPVFGSLGNHDHPELADASVELPIRMLQNESVCVTHGDSDFELVGLDQTDTGVEDLQAALGSDRRNPCTILLAHYPSTAYRLPPGRVDLQLSGHTHGGQIRLPYFGCVWANDRIPRSMAQGLHNVASTAVHVSAGIGVSGPLRIRLGCPPEITLLSVRPVKTAIRSVQQVEMVA